MPLLKVIQTLLSRSEVAGLQQFQEQIATKSDNQFLEYFSLLPYHLGSTAVRLTPSQLEQLQRDLGMDIDFTYWTIDELGRAHLLRQLAANPRYEKIVTRCYHDGDNREQIAVLKALPLLERNYLFCPLAREALRTNITSIFSALACNNPYPTLKFDQATFNNMVLKALFAGIAPTLIWGLPTRLNSALASMVEDWIDEREAAQREVLPQVWLLVAPYAQKHRLDRIYRYLEHSEREHRYWVVQALLLSGQSQHRNKLRAQLDRETDPQLVDELSRALASLPAAAKS